MVGKEPVNEDEFEALAERHSKGVDDDLSSISGSEDESDDSEEAQPRAQQGKPLARSNRLYFTVPGVDGVLPIWRPVVLAEKEYLQAEKGIENGISTDPENGGGLGISDANLLLRVQSLISSGVGSDENASRWPLTWLVLLAAGGHFAGIVVNRTGGEVLAHHTFHRCA